VVLNPSYYACPAIRLLARAVPDPAWLRLVADGLGLLRAARFGRWGLPPDWLALHRADGRLSLAPGRAPRFSYDAVRVPLYMAWAGLEDESPVRAALAFWNDPAHPHLPAWVDLGSNQISPYPAGEGVAAIRHLVADKLNLGRQVTAVVPQGRGDYYASMLKIMTLLTQMEIS
jgi:endoglucanase